MTEIIHNFEKRNTAVNNDDANTFSDVINELYGKDKMAAPRSQQNALDKILGPDGTDNLPSLGDLLKRLDKDNEIGKERLESVPTLTDKQVEDSAKQIAAIIGRNGDFSYGGKNEKLREIFSQAAAAGKESFDRVVQSVNKQLAASGLSLQAEYNLETEKKLRDLGDVALTSYPPIYPNARFEQTTKAQVSLSLSSKAQEEDSLKFERLLSRRTVRESYRPSLDELKYEESKH